MAGPARLPDLGFMDRRLGIIMAQDVVFRVAMITEGKFFSRCGCPEGLMDIFLIFFSFDGMAASAIHIDKTFPEMKEGLGVRVAVYTGNLALMMDISGPFFRVNMQRSQTPIVHDLRYFRFAMTGKTIFVGECWRLAVH
jgi:hypothetical protein